MIIILYIILIKTYYIILKNNILYDIKNKLILKRYEHYNK